jgi:uncharacterized membrane protein YebE (DUF533 family)
MSLVGTLAKVAIGIAAAKGIGHVMSQRAGSGGSVDGGFIGGQGTVQPSTACAQPLGDPLNSVLGGKGQAGGGLGGLLEQLAAAAGAGASPGATAPASGGGLDALIRGLADAASGAGTASKGTTSKADAGGSFADMLNQSFQNFGEPKAAPTPQQDAAAGLMLRAMLQAAKCDGKIDEGEKKKLLETLGDASSEDMEFVNRELSAPIDVQALVKQVPKGLESQIYAVSVMGINLDNQQEAEYLAELASALGLGPREVNAIHAKFGIPALFS